MSLFRRARSNLIWVLMSDVVAKGATIVVTIYLARVLGVTEFGVLGLGIAIASTLWPLVDLGTNGYGTREIARDHSNAHTLLPSLNSMRLTASVIVLIASAIVIQTIGFEESKKWTILATLLYMTTYAITPDWVARGIERMSIGFAINAFVAGSFILGAVVLVSGPEDTTTAGLVRSFSFAIGAIVGLVILSRLEGIRFRFTAQLDDWLSLIRRTYHFLINRVATNLGQYIPFFAVSIILTDMDTGLFAAPHRLYIVAVGGMAAITSAVYPILTDLYQKDPEKFRRFQRKLVDYILLLFIPAAGLGIIASDRLMNLIFGTEYLPAASVLTIMLLTLPLLAMRSLYMFTLLSAGYEKYAFPANMAGVIIQLIIAVNLVPTMGVEGAAIGMLAGELTSATILISLSTKKIGVGSPLQAETFTVLGITGVLICLQLWREWHLGITIGISLIAYAAYGLKTGLIPLNKLINRRS